MTSQNEKKTAEALHKLRKEEEFQGGQISGKNANEALRGLKTSHKGYTPELFYLIRETALAWRTTCPVCGREVRYQDLKIAACIYCEEEKK